MQQARLYSSYVPLDGEQEQAIKAGVLPTLVVGGSGSGKSLLVAERVLSLLHNQVAAGKIIIFAPSWRGVQPLTSCLHERLGTDAPCPVVTTLQAAALDVWRATHATPPIVLSDSMAWQLFASLTPNSSEQEARVAWEAVAESRYRLEPTPQEYFVWTEKYMVWKQTYNLVDTFDLLEFWSGHSQAGLLSLPWSNVLVDDIHSYSPLELRVITGLLTPSGEGFFATLAPFIPAARSQSTAGGVLAYLQERIPHLLVFSLQRDYQASAKLVTVKRKYLEELQKTVLDETACTLPTAGRKQAGQVAVFSASSDVEEAGWISRMAVKTGGLSQTAVLVRTSALIPYMRSLLAEQGLTVFDPRQECFWRNRRIGYILGIAGASLGVAGRQDMLSKVASCPDTVLARGPLGVAAYYADSHPFDEEFWNSDSFRKLCKEYEEQGSWAGLLTWIALQQDGVFTEGAVSGVRIFSYTDAGTRCFDTVFLPCLEDGLTPFAGTGLFAGYFDPKQRLDLALEQRLFYQALGCARDRLFLSYAAKRMPGNKELRLPPSRLLTLFGKSLPTPEVEPEVKIVSQSGQFSLL